MHQLTVSSFSMIIQDARQGTLPDLLDYIKESVTTDIQSYSTIAGHLAVEGFYLKGGINLAGFRCIVLIVPMP
jgi:hypothetical protein